MGGARNSWEMFESFNNRWFGGQYLKLWGCPGLQGLTFHPFCSSAFYFILYHFVTFIGAASLLHEGRLAGILVCQPVFCLGLAEQLLAFCWSCMESCNKGVCHGGQSSDMTPALHGGDFGVVLGVENPCYGFSL